ncbi:hypothetical protein ACWD4B_20940 [Streptomyces sp. NPDC002536]
MSVLPVVPARYAPPSVRPAAALRWEGRPEAAGRLWLVAQFPAPLTGRDNRTVTRRPRAHWHVVTGPDGRTRLEAEWH